MMRVLQCVNVMDRAGLENMLMNYYRNIDRSKVQFDFLTHRPGKGAYDEEIIGLGGKVYHAPRLYPQNYPVYFRWMKTFFAQHPEYRIVHSHIDAMSYFPLLAAKKAGIPVRIAHSHSSKLDWDLKLLIKFPALKLIPHVSNYHCACGNVAGHFMFRNQNFRVIPNAIDIQKFAFRAETRIQKREELGLTNHFVVGHVGRYCYIKNQLFLLDVFSKIRRERAEAHLLLIGKGEDEQKIRDKIRNLNLDDYVTLLIDRADVDQLYQVMDAFAMPSLFEGLPVVGVEAQANGLPCVVSGNISKEILLTDSIRMMDSISDAEAWKNSILSAGTDRNPLAEQQLEAHGYSVKSEAKKLLNYYQSLETGLK